MQKAILLLILLLTSYIPALAAQSLTLNGTSQYGKVVLPNSSPYTSITPWRVEFRAHTLASGVTYRFADNEHFYIQINSAGILTIFSWDGDIADTTLDVSGFATHLSDVVIRIQRDTANSRYTAEAWDSNSTTRFAAATGAMSSIAARNFGNNNFYVGARSIEQAGSAGAYVSGRIAFFRWYTSIISYESSTKPILYANTANLLQYEFEGNSNDSSVNGQNLGLVGSPTYNTTPTISPIASAGTDVGGKTAGATFSLSGTNSVAGDAGPITTYSWTRTVGSGTISSPSVVTTNITGIGSGQSTFQLQVGDGVATATDTVDIGVVALNSDGTVAVSDPKLNLIFGPLLPSNSVGSQVLPWYDAHEEETYEIHNNFPIRAPRSNPQGTVSIPIGSAIVTGVGTLFTKQITPEVPLRVVGVSYTISSIDSDTQITLTTTASSTITNSADYDQIANNEEDNMQGYWNYYDSALTAYIACARSGLSKWCTVGDKIAESWWSYAAINYGANDPANYNSPRLIALGGLMVRAIRGKTEYWDWIDRWVDMAYRSGWVMPRKNYEGFYIGVRDGGLALLYAVWISQVLPTTGYNLYANGTLASSTGTCDATCATNKRTAWFTDSLDGAMNYFARLQRADGSFRWFGDNQAFLGGAGLTASATTLTLSSDPGTNWRDGNYTNEHDCATNTCDIKIGNEIMTYTSRTGATITGITRGQYGTTAVSHANGALVSDWALGYYEQTFHVGVGIGHAFIDLMRIIEGNSTYATEYNTFRNAIIFNTAEGMLMGYSYEPVGDTPSVNSRHIAYALHSWGDWGTAKDGMPDTVTGQPTLASVPDARHNISTWVHMLGFAYHTTGLQWQKSNLEEVLSASYGRTGYSGTIGVSDGQFATMNYYYRTGSNPMRSLKEANEWQRQIGRAFAWRYVTPNVPTNKPPLFTPGRDRVFVNGTSNPTFTARGIDEEGTSLTYSWATAAGCTYTLSGASTATVTVTSPLTNNLPCSLVVTATDGAGNSVKEWVNFRTSIAGTENQPPVANVTSQNVTLANGTTSSSTALNASSSTDAEGNTIHYRWYQTGGTANATISNTDIANPNLSGLQNGKVYTFRVFVYDNVTRTIEEPGVDAVDVRVVVSAGSTPATRQHKGGKKISGGASSN